MPSRATARSLARRTVVAVGLTPALTAALVVLPTLPAPAARPVPVPPDVQQLQVTDADGVTTAAEDDARAALRTGPSARPVVSVVESRPQRTRSFDLVGVTWPDGADVVSVQVRVLEDAGWSDWEALPLVDEGPDAGTPEAASARVGTSPLLTDGATGVQVRVGSATAAAPQARVELVDPGTSAADSTAAGQAEPAASADAAGTAPRIVTRAQWGADESLTTGTHRVNEQVKALVLHHTAGTNDYTQAQAVTQLRGVYAYHTRSLGWSDIGYNLVLDRFGTVYEGRRGSIGLAVMGAHAGGFNRDTYGISVMGNFVGVTPPPAVIASLGTVIGWKAGQYGVDTRGSTVLRSAGGGTSKYAEGTLVTKPTVMGHKDVGNTSCPGNLYGYLPQLRSTAAGVAARTVPSLVGTFPKDFTGDGVADVLAVSGSGQLLLYAGNGSGALRSARQIGTGWGNIDTVVQVGDWTGDGAPDLIAREDATARLRVYEGSGTGTIVRSYVIGQNWGGMRALLGVGDINRDGRADLVGVHSEGGVFRYLGNGAGGFASSAQIGWGFSPQDTVVAGGDFSDDGDFDLLRRDAVGDLFLLEGTPSGTIADARKIGNGWGPTRQIVATGSWDRTPGQDLLARTATGALVLYSGNADGGFSGSTQIGTGWTTLTIVA